MPHVIGKRSRHTFNADENSLADKLAVVRRLPMVPTNNDLEVGSFYYIAGPSKLFLGRFSARDGGRLLFQRVTKYFPYNVERTVPLKSVVARNPTNIYKINQIEWPNRYADTLFDSSSDGSLEYSPSSSGGTKRRRARRRAASRRASSS